MGLPTDSRLRVLYHEYPVVGVGGSRMSLLNLILGLGSRVEAYCTGGLPEVVVARLPRTAVVLPNYGLRFFRQRSVGGRIGTTLRWWYYLLATTACLVAAILRHRVDIVHGNNEVTSNAPAILAAAITGRPCVCHLRGDQGPMRETRWLFRHVDHYIAISEHVRDFHVQEGVVSPQAASIIYNGIDVADLIRRSDDARMPQAGAPRIGMFGRMIEYKGHAYFLEAVSCVAERLPEARFTVHGPLPQPAGPDGAYYESVLRQCREGGLADRVAFAGPYSDVVAVMAQTDVMLCCSPYDNFGRVLFEAMACGVPVVAFDAGGVREVVEHGRNGLLVSNRDAKAMAEAVVQLCESRRLREDLAREGQATAQRHFDSAVNAQRVLGIYESLFDR